MMCLKKCFSSLVVLFCGFAMAQVEQDTLKMTAQDSSIVYSMELREFVITPDGVTLLTDEEKKAKLLLKRRVFKVFPYARLTSEKLMQMNATMAKLKTEREKKKYFKIVETYLEDEFEPKLKKLTRKEGQILVKLIHRQTGISTFDLIKEYKSGWKAFWANTAAKMFDIDLKTTYEPFEVQEDYQIENVLDAAFSLNQLTRQEASKPINFAVLSSHWRAKKKKENQVTE